MRNPLKRLYDDNTLELYLYVSDIIDYCSITAQDYLYQVWEKKKINGPCLIIQGRKHAGHGPAKGVCAPHVSYRSGTVLSPDKLEKKKRKNANLCANVQNQLEGNETGLISDRNPTKSEWLICYVGTVFGGSPSDRSPHSWLI